MADWITYKLTGAEDIVAKFRTLSQDMQRSVVKPAAMEAMRIVLASAKARAKSVNDPSTPNYIPDNITIIEDRKYFEQTGSTKVSVGVRKQKRGVGGGNTFYWHWVELGTSRSRAQPFMRNALAENREAVFQEFLSSARFQLIKLGLN